MALAFADRVRETTTTTGTGTITLAGAVTGYQSFSAIGNGNTTYYTINAGSQWEVGIGTYTASGTTLSRDTVLASSNAGSLVNFSAGTKDVFATYPAGKTVIQDASGNVGIGTASPGYKLDVAGQSRVYNTPASFAQLQSLTQYTGSAAPVGLGQGSDATGYLINLANAGMAFGTNGTEHLRITSTGDTVIADGKFLVWGNQAQGIIGDNATSTVRFYTSYAEAMRINSSRDLIIGATSGYGGKLTIVPTANPTTASASTNQLAIGEATVNSAYKLNVGYIFSGGVYSGSLQAIAGGTGAALLLNADGGNVGIGTMSPSYRLHVNSGAATTVGFFQSTGTSSFIGLSNANYTAYLGSFNDGSFRIQTPGSSFSDKVTVDISGNVALTKLAFNIDSPFYTGGNITAGSNALGIGTTGAAQVGFFTNNTERMRITSAGFVGIGTSSPSSKLTVLDGDIEVNATGLGNTLLSFNGTTANLTVNSSSAPLVFGTNSTERMRIDSSGNVGIGTTPGYVLDVYSAANGIIRVGGGSGTNQGAAFYVKNAANSNTLAAFGDRARIFGGTPDQLVSIFTSALPLTFDVNGSERARFDTSGNLGIGTSSPGVKLDVVGGIRGQALDATGTPALFSTSGGSVLYYNGAGVGVVRAYSNSGGAAGALTFNASGAEDARVDSSGNFLVGITGQIYPTANRKTIEVNGTSQSLFGMGVGGTGAAYILHDGTNMDIWQSRNGYMRFGTNGSERMRITSAGNVGIGTTSPQQLFVVSNGGAGGIEILPSGVIQSYNRSGAAYQALNIDASTHVFRIGVSEAARIASNGNMTVGSSSSFGRLASVAADGTYQLALVGTSKAVRMRSDTTNFKIEAVDQTLSSSYEPLWLGGSLIQFGTSTTERMRIDASGNVGIGITPSASDLPTIQSTYGIISGNAQINIAQNAYYSSGWKYTGTAAATLYFQGSGAHNWQIAASGTAGNAISFTQAMTLDASGNLGIGLTSYSSKLTVAGTIESTTGGVKFPDATTQTTKGIAAAWAQITSIATTSGTTAIFSNIPQTYTALRFAIVGVSHNGGTNGSIRMSVSSDGVTYSAAWNLGASIAAAATIDGALQGDSYTQDTCFFIGDNISSANASPYASVNGTYFMFKVTGGTKYVKFEWSNAASFDAGSITLYGR